VLFSLGQAYEGEIELVRGRQMQEAIKARLIQQFTSKAAEAYSKILTRYPLLERSEDAKLRLAALNQPIPKPTKAAVAQNKAEIESRETEGMLSSVMQGFQKHPSVVQATHVGEPPLVDPTPVSAKDVSDEATHALLGTTAAPSGKASVEVVSSGSTPPPSDAVPHSGDPTPGTAPADGSTPAPTTDNSGAVPAGATPPAAAAPPAGANPTAADPNELKCASGSERVEGGRTTGSHSGRTGPDADERNSERRFTGCSGQRNGDGRRDFDEQAEKEKRHSQSGSVLEES
jgi:outer membrane protein assembly factor BamD